jgi:hypothetical protein
LLIDFLDHVDSETLYLVATLSSCVESARQFLSSLSPVERKAAALRLLSCLPGMCGLHR